MIRRILTWPKDAAQLHQVSSVVSPLHQDMLKTLVRDMFDTMYAAGGVGLAAIQIGVPLRVFIMEVYTNSYVFVNPTIVMSGEATQMNEGCLSLPGYVEQVVRYPQVTIEAQDENGVAVKHTFTGIEAQCIQHEYEHLEGMIIPDKLTPTARTRLSSKMSKKGY